VPRSLAALLSLLLGAGLVLTGCGGESSVEAGAGGPAPQEVSESTQLTQVWPTSGLLADGADGATLSRPVLVVKVDNSSASAPQLGLDQADLVVEELVEGGMTRLAVFYYSRLPQVAGPVRSMRASDIGIVAPIGATMVTSGAAQVTLDRISAADIPYISEGGPGVYRESARSAPYNVMVDLAETARAIDTDVAALPHDYLPWGSAEDLPSGQKARSINVRFSGGHATDWRFAGGRYVNTNSNAAKDAPFPADTVLVLRVEVGDAGYRDPAGNPVPETILEGTGEAMIFHGGRLVRGTWSKATADSPLELATVAGPLVVPAGHTWIELVPAAGGEVRFAKK
jgi:hypothetical protein